MSVWQWLGCRAYDVTTLLLRTWPRKLKPRTRLLLTNKQGEVLVVRGWLSDGRWSLPGGGVHRSESLLDGVIRETYEETGVQVPPADCHRLGQQVIIHRGLQQTYECFRAELDAPRLNRRRPLEITALAWLKPTQLTEDIAHPQVIDALTRAGLKPKA